MWVAWIGLALLPASPALAHRLSSSSLRIESAHVSGSGTWTGRLTVPLRDLATIAPLDTDGDSAVTWRELQSADAELHTIVRSHLQLLADGQPLDLRFEPVAVDTLAGEPCASWGFSAPAPRSVRKIGVGYTLLFETDPDHRCLVRCAAGSSSDLPATAVLGPDRTSATFGTNSPTSAPPDLATFVAEGVHHIWIGFDHILFLLALLLPSVLRRGDAPVSAPSRFGAVLLEVTRVVTAFTAAHSITLGLAAFEVIRLPSRLVETVIAASVAIAALNNLVPFLRDRRWQVAFGFGLIHGFGFAGVLAELDLPRNAFARGLLGFNLGVEVGQLAIVALFLPIAFGLRHSWVYRRLALQGGSLAILGLATLWTAQRAFNG